MNKREPKLAEAEKGPQRLQNARFAPANRKRLSPPALRTFLAIADLWRLTEEQRLLVLGYPSRSTYHNWCKQAREHGAFTLDVDVPLPPLLALDRKRQDNRLLRGLSLRVAHRAAQYRPFLRECDHHVGEVMARPADDPAAP